MHGLLGSKRNWQAMAKKLCRNREVYTVDVRNHGDSEHAPGMTYKDMSEDLLGFVKSINESDIDLLGHSMGGKIAMIFALSNPDFVSKLVIEDVYPGISHEAVHSFPKYFQAMNDVEFDQSIPTLAELRRTVDEQLMQAFPEPGLRSFILTNLTQKEGIYKWKVNLAELTDNLPNITGWPEHVNTTFDKPTLFISGEKSTRHVGDSITEIRQYFPNAELKEIKGAGHWIHAEKPAEFLETVTQFLDKS